MMEAHLAQTKPVQVNKIASSCEICSGPHDTQYCMEYPERVFVEYASTRTDEAENKWYTFKPEENNLGDTYNPSWKSHPNLRWRQVTQTLGSNQSNLEGKLATFMAFQDAKTFSDTVKNPKLNTNLTSSTRSHPAGDPQSSSNSFKSVNVIQTCFNSNTCNKKDQFQVNTLTVSENETPTLKEPQKTLEDEFADLHLNRSVLEVLVHVLMYDALLDKYIASLELGENRSEYIQRIAPEKMKYPGLFILPCRLGDFKPFDTIADLGSCVNLLPLKLFKELKVGLLEESDDVLGLAEGTKSYPVGIVRNVKVHVGKLKLFEDFHVVDMKREPTCPLLVGRGFLATSNAIIDCKKAKITVGERLTRSIFGVKELDFGDDNEPYWTTIGKRAIPINLKGNMWESEDLIKNLINWNRTPKEGDGVWHIRIELIGLNGEKFDKAFQSIPTNMRLSLKENPSDILNLDHFHDS
ncbi:DNA-directed DNA polymerase [Tanacetum coccineum]|uniref:DNA-directed DNA polymerase n=1 Tax=Tanacetum coccineum TaxID=301880 RepID=A0ABQ5HB11_9ASTR